jgi:hypothetical protein
MYDDVYKVVGNAMKFVATIEESESYLTSVKKKFDIFFTPISSSPLPGAGPGAGAAPTTIPAVLDVGGIAYNTVSNEYVYIVKQDITKNMFDVRNKNDEETSVELTTDKTLLVPIMSKPTVDTEMNTRSITIQKLLEILPPRVVSSGGKGRRRGTRKYQKRRGNGNNVRRRLTRKVKGQGGGGGGGGRRHRGGKIYRKTMKHVRRGRGGRRGHRRTIKKHYRR